MDSKGRISMPTKHRDALAPLIIVPNPMPDEPCLLIYSLEAWKAIEADIASRPNTKANRKIMRKFIGKAEESMLDRNGRLLVKADFRDFAKFDKKIVLVGQGNKLELWDEATWIAINEDEDDDDYIEALEDLVF
ncbi:MAG: division/cell wall cluster transcriptional repressor MraZ [Gammaproteobacteria bacterium]|nr:MAG: division/cell wall cluster transcriptional repressor MraZ [Gammaproteobacteria bacterium]